MIVVASVTLQQVDAAEARKTRKLTFILSLFVLVFLYHKTQVEMLRAGELLLL